MAPFIERDGRRWRRAGPAVIVAAAMVACACSLVTSIPDLTGGSVSDATADGADVVEAGTDAGMDVRVEADAGAADVVTGDAPADGSDGGGFPPGSWCAQQPAAGMVLCDDFDFESLTFSRWTLARFDVAGSFDLSPVHVSSPSSLEIHVPAHTASNFFIEALEENVPGDAGATSIALDYQFQPAEFPDGGADVLIASIAQGASAPRVAVTVQVGPGGTWLQEQITDATGGDTFNSSTTSPSVPPGGSFTHLELVVTFGSSANATLAYGGATIVTLPLKGTWQGQADTAVYLGDWYTVSTPGYDLLYDDAVIRQQ